MLPRYAGEVRGGQDVPFAPTPPSGAPVLTLPTPRPLTSFGRCQRSAAASPRVGVLPGSRLRPGMCSQCSAGLAPCSAPARPTRSPLSHPTSCPSQREPLSAMLTCQQRVGVYTTNPLHHHTTAHLTCPMTPGEGPGSLLAPPLTIWPANPGLLPHKPIQPICLTMPFLDPPPGTRWRRAPNRHRRARIPTLVRVNRPGPPVVRAVGRRRARLLLEFFSATASEHMDFTPPTRGPHWGVVGVVGVARGFAEPCLMATFDL